MGTEFELKYRAGEACQRRLAERFPGPWKETAMETVYYDTPDRVLSAARITLRRRMENGVAVCTVKAPAGDAGRGEWECLCEDIRRAIPELCKLGGPRILLSLTGPEPVCGARFVRRSLLITREAFTAELALDAGVLVGGGREAPLWEAELELKSGSREAMVAFAREIARQMGLKVQPKSKFRRAMDLAEGKGDSYGDL